MSKNTRGVKAYISDSNTTNCAKGIPKKHWVVYYYLLSISKWNYKDKEQHRYVYYSNYLHIHTLQFRR